MMTYTANSLIEKAYQLQDLQNSAFISHTEALSLLNDHYTQMYQRQINKSEQIFLTRDTLTVPTSTQTLNSLTIHRYTLPNNFFQLRALYNLKDMSLLLRKPVSSFQVSYQSYDIVDTFLEVYTPVGTDTIGEGLVIEYYPVPDTITAPDLDDETDTTVDYVFTYPNNIFFTLLQYQLALDFVSKQGVPTEWIQQQLTQAEQTFYDTLGRDNQMIRITNSYQLNNNFNRR